MPLLGPISIGNHRTMAMKVFEWFLRQTEMQRTPNWNHRTHQKKMGGAFWVIRPYFAIFRRTFYPCGRKMAGTHRDAQISWESILRGQIDPHMQGFAIILIRNGHLVERNEKKLFENFRNSDPNFLTKNLDDRTFGGVQIGRKPSYEVDESM